MFGKKNETSPVAVIEPEPAVVQIEPAPVPASVTVRVVRPLFEQGANYKPDDEFSATTARAAQLEKLGLVAIVDPNAPPPGPKLQVAREEFHKAGEESAGRTRERTAIEREVHAAEETVNGLQVVLKAADGLEAVRTAQDALTAAGHDLETKRALLLSVAQRAQAANIKAQAARKRVEDLEDRATWIKGEGIPKQREHLESCRRIYAEKQTDARAILEERVHPSEVALAALQTELSAIEG
jgi:hypothetical protein